MTNEDKVLEVASKFHTRVLLFKAAFMFLLISFIYLLFLSFVLFKYINLFLLNMGCYYCHVYMFDLSDQLRFLLRLLLKKSISTSTCWCLFRFFPRTWWRHWARSQSWSYSFLSLSYVLCFFFSPNRCSFPLWLVYASKWNSSSILSLTLTDDFFKIYIYI